MAKKTVKTIMNDADIARAVKRMAHEILEKNKASKDLVFIGIIERGVTLAKRTAQIVKDAEGMDVPVGGLDVSLYRDDLAQKGSSIKVKKSDIPFNVDGKIVVLFDDVVFAGRTTRAALDGLNDFGRASKVQLAALVDRGGRELPIQPDFCGKKISTITSEDVKVSLKEIDGVDQVVLQ